MGQLDAAVDANSLDSAAEAPGEINNGPIHGSAKCFLIGDAGRSQRLQL